MIVDLIALDGEKILLVKRAVSDKSEAGMWSIPGGGGKEGESPEAALRREISEELNCRIKRLRFFKSYPDGSKIADYFFGEIEGEIKLNSELEEYRWFTLEELKSQNLKLAFGQEKVIAEFLVSDWLKEHFEQ